MKIPRFVSFRYPTILAIIFILGLVQSLAIAQVLSDPKVNIPNFGKVNEHYYRGSQPEAEDFVKLKNLGVKTIVDLRQDYLADAGTLARHAGLQYINIPLTTERAATEDQTTYFLSIVNNPVNWPVYVHCKGGRHRTGEMTAIYRITNEGWTADQAYEEMKKYDFKNSIFYPRALKKYVFTYYDQFSSLNATKSKGTTATQRAAMPEH